MDGIDIVGAIVELVILAAVEVCVTIIDGAGADCISVIEAFAAIRHGILCMTDVTSLIP